MKYQRFTLLVCKDIGIRKFEFVAKPKLSFCAFSVLYSFLWILQKWNDLFSLVLCSLGLQERENKTSYSEFSHFLRLKDYNLVWEKTMLLNKPSSWTAHPAQTTYTRTKRGRGGRRRKAERDKERICRTKIGETLIRKWPNL